MYIYKKSHGIIILLVKIFLYNFFSIFNKKRIINPVKLNFEILEERFGSNNNFHWLAYYEKLQKTNVHNRS